ncbi:hypothetical protein BZA70DRAFT_105695 [Myxozyma melibiosi]|uniref:Coiled-coil domain-containing protein 16 n=1 Tax=Myxozyma melibiosi TaxID=54550 RepID=A0ABR1F9H2_9ASCO
MDLFGRKEDDDEPNLICWCSDLLRTAGSQYISALRSVLSLCTGLCYSNTTQFTMEQLFRQSAAAQNKPVEHRLAQYTDDRRIRCVACGLMIGSSEQQWNMHIATPTHKSSEKKWDETQRTKAKRQLERSSSENGQAKRVKNGGKEEEKERESGDGTSAPDLDAEWAAFQKDIAESDAAAWGNESSRGGAGSRQPTNIAAGAGVIEQAPEIYGGQGSITDPTTEVEEKQERRRVDDREVLQDALLEEFEEQKELEERVQKLKDKWKEVRMNAPGRSSKEEEEKEEEEEEDDDDDDEDDEDDDLSLFIKKR